MAATAGRGAVATFVAAALRVDGEWAWARDGVLAQMRVAIASEGSQAAAARRIGVDLRSLQRWLHDYPELRP